MLFRKSDGTFVELNRYDFKSDVIYYQKIMELLILKQKKDISDQSSISVNENESVYEQENTSITKILQKL
jgi:hypothetical protein